MTTKKTASNRPSKTAVAPVRKKLALKKDALKDLTAPANAGRQPKGGRSSSGGSIVGSVAGSAGG